MNPGAERSIVVPIQRAKDIFNSLGVQRQVAAANYQLALYYSKVWTCQRDELQTKQKLSKAFVHFETAHRWLFSNLRTNEDTFVCLILDLSSLYSTVSMDYGCQQKALLCCLDTCDAFSEDAIRCASMEPSKNDNSPVRCSSKKWFDRMKTLDNKVEERIFGLLSKLVKIEKNSPTLIPRYEKLYRNALKVKLSAQNGTVENSGEFRSVRILSLVKQGHMNTS